MKQEICPKCENVYTYSRKEDLIRDLKVTAVLSVVSVGILAVFLLPYMTIKYLLSPEGYKPNAHRAYRCGSCKHKWIVQPDTWVVITECDEYGVEG